MIGLDRSWIAFVVGAFALTAFCCAAIATVVCGVQWTSGAELNFWNTFIGLLMIFEGLTALGVVGITLATMGA